MIRGDGGIDRWQRAGMHACLLLAALAWCWHAGRDLNWDLFNYHVYAGFSVFHDRFDQDFFAAFPAYYNPYAQVPFHLLSRSGLPALAVALLLALVQGLIPGLVYELCLRLTAGVASSSRQAIAGLAALLALLNPVYLLELGTSFTDGTTALPVVAAWLLLAGSLASPAVGIATGAATGATNGSLARSTSGPMPRSVAGRFPWPLLVAGLLMGAATGLKLSNAIFAVATLPALLWWRGGAAERLRLLALFSTGCAIGFAAVAGPWAWRLHQTFGNPMFPMFNGLFRSPDFVTEGAVLDRFLPRSLIDALTLPFRMVLPGTMVHIETESPDLRYAGLIVIAAVALAWRALARARSAPAAAAPVDGRVVGMLATLFLAAWVLWLLTSGNSRYFIPGGALAGLLIVAICLRSLPSRPVRWTMVACGSIALLQVAQVVIAAAPRFSPAPWSDRWIEVSVPQRFRDQPYLFLTLQAQSLSFLAPEVHPQSGFFNATGGFSFDPQGPGGARARRLIERFEGRLRALVSLDVTDGKGRFRVPDLRSVDHLVLPWGYVVDRSDCDSIAIAAGLPVLPVAIESDSGPTVPGTVLTCALKPAPAGSREAQDAARQRIATVFEHLEQACPRLFTPRGLRIEGGDGRWQKAYHATDTRAHVANGRVFYFSAIRGGDPVDVGRVDDWLLAPQPVDCNRRAGPAFSGLGH